MMTTEQIAINVTIAGINTERNNIAMAQMNKEFYQDKLNEGLVLTDNESHEIQFWADAANSAESKLAWLEQRLANFNTNLSEI